MDIGNGQTNERVISTITRVSGDHLGATTITWATVVVVAAAAALTTTHLVTTIERRGTKMKIQCLLVTAVVTLDHSTGVGVGMEACQTGTLAMAMGIAGMVMIINVVAVLAHIMEVAGEGEEEEAVVGATAHILIVATRVLASAEAGGIDGLPSMVTAMIEGVDAGDSKSSWASTFRLWSIV